MCPGASIAARGLRSQPVSKGTVTATGALHNHLIPVMLTCGRESCI